jgi:signal peptidase II
VISTAPSSPSSAPPPAAPPALLSRPWRFAVAAGTGVALDQLSKFLVFHLVSSSWPLWPEVLHLKPAENPGAAFSLFSSAPWLVLLLTAIAVPLLGWWYARVRNTARGAFLWALALLCAGAAGNLVDRLFLGKVRDFIDFVPPLPLIGHWATFNFADLFICVGVGLYLLAEWLPARGKEAAKPAK